MSKSGSSPIHASATPTTTVSSYASPSVMSSASASRGSSVPPTPTPVGSFSLAFLRPVVPPASFPSNPTFKPQVYPQFPAMPPYLIPPSTHWLQAPQAGGLRVPFLPCPPVYPGPFALAPRGVFLPSVPLPDPQPPGITPVVTPGGVFPLPLTSSGVSISYRPGMQLEVLPPGTGLFRLLDPAYSA